MNFESIAVIGGGNIGTYFACVCAEKGKKVTVYSSKPAAYGKKLRVINAQGRSLYEAEKFAVTDDLNEAAKADVLFVTYPAFIFSAFAEKIEKLIRPGQVIFCVPGTGGAEFAFRGCIEKGAILCGIQRVPAVARLVEYGKTVCVEGKRNELFLASIPEGYAPRFSEFLAKLFDMPCYPLPNYLCVTMTPSNPILHTARLATMFDDYTGGRVYSKCPLFYGEWTDASSKRLLECDAEHQHILGALKDLDLSSVKSLVVHYDGSDTPEKMTGKLRSIKSLHDLSSPMRKVAGGYVPDFESRYFKADFPYGLEIISEFASILNIEAPAIRKTMEWYRKVTGDQFRFDLAKYGIHSEEDINQYYKR